MKNKIILDLCGGTGAWSAPYKNHGYDVRNITLPDYDVRTYKPPENVYGILAAPPCTMFSLARTKAKKPRDLKEGMEIVIACLKIIWECQYKLENPNARKTTLKFWALENPNGMLKFFLGKPAFIFDPWEFGDSYKKRTALWGHFNEPVKTHKDITEVLTKEQIEKHKTNSQALPKFDSMKSRNIHPERFGELDRQERRAITPAGFAKAFYKANQ